jgi:hypothetical protein
MQVFIARVHTQYEGSTVYGVFANIDAAIAHLKELEPTYSDLRDGELHGNIVYNRTDGCDSLQVVVYTVKE